MNLSEGQLVEKARAGDAAAYGELFNQYQSKIYNFAYSLTGNSEDAKDTAQQAFIKVYEALPRLDKINFSAYLHRTARNVAFDELKARKRLAGDAPLEQKEETDIHADPQRAALLGEQQDDVRAVAAGLPARMRTALTLQELPEMSLEGCPLCRLALEEQTEASKSYRGIAPLAPPAALAADFFSALDEASAAELEVTPDGGNDMTIEMPQLDLEAEGIPTTGTASGRPWYRSPKTWAVIGAGAGAIALGLLVGANSLNTGTRTSGPAPDKALIDTYGLDGGIQSTDVPIRGIAEATKALEKTLETAEASETTSAAEGAAETSETTSADPASTGPASGDSSTTASPDTTAPPAPGGLSPDSGSVQENESITFTWDPVSDPSGVTYSIEIERMLKDGSWPSLLAQTGLAQPSFNHNLGDTQERWRVWTVDGAGNAGMKTDWYLIQRSEIP